MVTVTDDRREHTRWNFISISTFPFYLYFRMVEEEDEGRYRPLWCSFAVPRHAAAGSGSLRSGGGAACTTRTSLDTGLLLWLAGCWHLASASGGCGSELTEQRQRGDSLAAGVVGAGSSGLGRESTRHSDKWLAPFIVCERGCAAAHPATSTVTEGAESTAC